MKTKIVTRKDGLEIQLAEAAEKTDGMLAAFKECQEGRCSCPTQEYKKVASLNVAHSQAGITLSLKAKEGQEIDVGEIEKCLAHTEDRIKR